MAPTRQQAPPDAYTDEQEQADQRPPTTTENGRTKAAKVLTASIKEAPEPEIRQGFWEAIGAIIVAFCKAIGAGILWFLAWLPWMIYVVVALILFGFAYYHVTSEGWRLTLPTLGMKLHKLTIPGIENLRRYQTWNKIDLANVMSLVLELATLWAYDVALKHYMSEEPSVHPRWNAEKFRRVVNVLATGIIAFDAFLFFRGTQALGWGASAFSLTAFATTVGWVFLIVIASIVSVQLQPQHKKE